MSVILWLLYLFKLSNFLTQKKHSIHFATKVYQNLYFIFLGSLYIIYWNIRTILFKRKWLFINWYNLLVFTAILASLFIFLKHSRKWTYKYFYILTRIEIHAYRQVNFGLFLICSWYFWILMLNHDIQFHF